MLYPSEIFGYKRQRVTLTDRQKRTLLEGYGKTHLLAGDGKDLDGQFPSAKSGPSDEIKEKWKTTQQTHPWEEGGHNLKNVSLLP